MKYIIINILSILLSNEPGHVRKSKNNLKVSNVEQNNFNKEIDNKSTKSSISPSYSIVDLDKEVETYNLNTVNNSSVSSNSSSPFNYEKLSERSASFEILSNPENSNVDSLESPSNENNESFNEEFPNQNTVNTTNNLNNYLNNKDDSNKNLSQSLNNAKDNLNNLKTGNSSNKKEHTDKYNNLINEKNNFNQSSQESNLNSINTDKVDDKEIDSNNICDQDNIENDKNEKEEPELPDKEISLKKAFFLTLLGFVSLIALYSTYNYLKQEIE